MSVDRKEGRRTNHRAFRPTLEHETLETRVLMSGKTSKLPAGVFLRNPKPGIAFNNNNPQFLSQGAPRFPVAQYPRGNKIATQTAHGGQSVIVAAPDGSHFKISLTQFIPPAGQGQSQSSSGASVPGAQNPIQGQIPGGGPVQPIGTVRAYAMPRGRVGLIIDGTTTQSELDISPQPFPQRKGYAHSFAYGQTNQSKILDIGQITVNSGQIGAILGFHTANLSGPLVSQGTTAIDRIAFNNLLPGASIQTGGDLNTLDVLNNVKLDGGPGIVIGRDLNLFNVGQDLTLLNGASVNVGRFLGATPNRPRGPARGRTSWRSTSPCSEPVRAPPSPRSRDTSRAMCSSGRGVSLRQPRASPTARLPPARPRTPVESSPRHPHPSSWSTASSSPRRTPSRTLS